MSRKKRRKIHGTDSIPDRLKEIGFRTYREYLSSPLWAGVRDRFRKSRPAHCEICGLADVRLSVHHKTYKRLGYEHARDLALICDGCHKLIHSYGIQLQGWLVNYLRKHKGKPPPIIPTVSVTRGNDEGAPWS